jgi:hypothetical protein
MYEMTEEKTALLFALGNAVDQCQKERGGISVGVITETVCRFAATAAAQVGFDDGIKAFLHEIKRQADAQGVDVEMYFSESKEMQ